MTVRRFLGPALPLWSLLGMCAVVAGASLVLPATIGFDPWAWLVWGREVTRLDLDSTGGPSWKPLPVVITAVLAPLGSAAPAMWLVVARTAGLLAVAGVYRLAARFGGVPAGLIGSALLVLTPDPEPRFLRTLLEGHDAPMTAALALWAIDRHLAGRHATSLVLLTALALLRPEAWPFLLLHVVWSCWERPQSRPLAVASTAVIPVLWFGGDWWGSGSGWHGAGVAQIGSGTAWDRLWASSQRVGELVPLPVWALAAVALATALRRREWTVQALASGAVIWCAVIVGMATVLGYAAISRFFLPAAALLCVLAGVGAVRIVGAAQTRRARGWLAVGVLVISLPFLAHRSAGIADVVDEVRYRSALRDDLLAALDDAGGAQTVLRCPRFAVDASTLLRTSVAWELDVPLHRVHRTPGTGERIEFVVTSGPRDRAIAALSPSDRQVLARNDHWTVHAIGCQPG